MRGCRAYKWPSERLRAPLVPRRLVPHMLLDPEERGAKPEVKSEVKSEVKPEDSKAPKAGGKRARGGQPGPRGANGAPATYAKPPKVLKGANAPTVDLVSPDKGTSPRSSIANRHALRFKFQCILNALPASSLLIRAAHMLCLSLAYLSVSLPLSILCDAAVMAVCRCQLQEAGGPGDQGQG